MTRTATDHKPGCIYKHPHEHECRNQDDMLDFEHYVDNPDRQRQVTGGVKDNRGKSRVDLIPSAPLLGAGNVLAYGTHKYKPHNWRLGLRYSDTMASLQRHLLAFNDGEDLDPESGLPHLDHAMCQLLFLSEYYHTGTGIDDRWSRSAHDKAKL